VKGSMAEETKAKKYESEMWLVIIMKAILKGVSGEKIVKRK